MMIIRNVERVNQPAICWLGLLVNRDRHTAHRYKPTLNNKKIVTKVELKGRLIHVDNRPTEFRWRYAENCINQIEK